MSYHKMLHKLMKNMDKTPLSSSKIVKLIDSVPRVFVVGIGRSGLVGKFFAMRLMHLGKDVNVVGDSTTQKIHQGDLLIAISGSGKTPMLIQSVQVAKEVGAKVLVLTSKPESEVAYYADEIILFSAKSKTDTHENEVMPLGTEFELSSLIFLEASVVDLMIHLGVDEDFLRERHTNLE